MEKFGVYNVCFFVANQYVSMKSFNKSLDKMRIL